MHRTARDNIVLGMEDDITSISQDIDTGNTGLVNTESATVTASVLPPAGRGRDENAEAQSKLTPAMVVQIILVAALVTGFLAFYLTRRARYKRDKKRDEERAMHTALYGVITSPNGLGGHSGTPPPYYEALKHARNNHSPTSSSNITQPYRASAYSSQGAGYGREKSASMVMDECWKAVYAAEDNMNAAAAPDAGRKSLRSIRQTAILPQQGAGVLVDVEEPTTPRSVAHGEMRQSMSRWLRNQKWIPGTKPPSSIGVGPLSSNPTHLPVPPSPSYTGVPRTPSSLPPPTPSTATCLTPGYPNSPEPTSARSWLTGDDRLSIRASIPSSVLFPSPLQPAPPPRRWRNSTQERRDSLDSQSNYESSWKTITPIDDPPPEYAWEARSRDSAGVGAGVSRR